MCDCYSLFNIRIVISHVCLLKLQILCNKTIVKLAVAAVSYD